MIIEDLIPIGPGIGIPSSSFKKEKESATEDPIHPKDVFESMEIPSEGLLEFYENDHRFLGRRNLEDREMIYDHLRKTREIVDVEVNRNNSRVHIFWKMKKIEKQEEQKEDVIVFKKE